MTAPIVPDPVVLRPPDGWVGDVIPFAQNGEVSLFYLHDRRDPARPGTGWHRYTTADYGRYVYRGVSFEHGGDADPDLHAYTGSIVQHDGVTHLFYAGVNPDVRVPSGEPAQLVMHATSTDGMATWVRHPEQAFGAPTGYHPADWRDPFVFRPDAAAPWHMLVAARRLEGPERRRGVIAHCVSDDLSTWSVTEPFWSPDRYVTMECPEVFHYGSWWYLVYSEFSERFATRYRISSGPFGPWSVPDHDTIDGRAFYAAKSAELHGRRYFAGWIATKEGERDDGAWQWAGEMAVHEAVPGEDGTLELGMPAALRATFDQATPLALKPVLGPWRRDAGTWSVDVPDAYAVAVAEAAPDQYLLEVTIEVGHVRECGVILRASPDGDEGYSVRLEPRAGRMVFDRWPRARTGPGQWQISGDVPYAIELERSAVIEPGRHQLSILVDGTACVAYLDGRVAMSARMYDRRAGGIGVFVGEGSCTFGELTVATRDD